MDQKNGKLIVVRHHESEWNKLSKWTGTYDADLTRNGIEMAEKMGRVIEDIEIDRAVSSELKRSYKTLRCMLDASGRSDIEIERSSAINERDYGDHTGKNKWDMKEIFGEGEFNNIRRAWDHPVPNGETLKMVYQRVIPYYVNDILPGISEGKNTLLVAHTNSIRALIKYIEDISNEDIKDLEIPFGIFFIYEVDRNSGRILKKETRTTK